MFYGVTRQSQLIEMCEDVCKFFAKSNRGTVNAQNAIKLCVETLCAETRLGEARDAHFFRHGIGVAQFDYIGFIDVKSRMPFHLKERVRDHWGIEINKAEHEDLAFNPLLSIIFMRNFYMLRPGLISSDRFERAHYWKKHYNSAAGKGTPGHYLKLASEILDK